jgi:ketosteroid isomerase-like protein
VSDEDQVRQVIGRLNEASSGHPAEEIPDAMDGLWHRDAVILAGAQEMVRGRDACIKSYQDFVRQAALEDTTLGEPSVEVWDDTAVATSSWHLTYDLDGGRHTESGHESFVLVRTGSGW